MFRVAARGEIVDRDDAMTFPPKPVGEMRPQKTGPTGDDGDGISFIAQALHLSSGWRGNLPAGSPGNDE